MCYLAATCLREIACRSLANKHGGTRRAVIAGPRARTILLWIAPHLKLVLLRPLAPSSFRRRARMCPRRFEFGSWTSPLKPWRFWAFGLRGPIVLSRMVFEHVGRYQRMASPLRDIVVALLRNSAPSYGSSLLRPLGPSSFGRRARICPNFKVVRFFFFFFGLRFCD